MLIFAAVTIDLGTLGIVSAIIAVASGLLGVWKAKPERDALVVSAKQGGVEILNSIISAQSGEIERLQRDGDRKQEAIEWHRARADRMEAKLDELRGTGD